jgi:NAD(P)-dependent dehydrogenase (short-subunit alcohol dehydrogenase family)
MESAADATEAHFGKVHVVVNNAGVAVGGSLDTMSYDDWDWVMGVNLDGVVNGLQAFVNRIKRHGEGGHIVNTASMAGHMGIPGLGVYNASKWAVVGISETLKADLEPHDIGVSVLCPGVVKTTIFSSGRDRPEQLCSSGAADVARAIGGAGGEERLAEILEGALDASVVGDMVLHAIQTDELYIFTHPEFKEPVGSRSQDLADAFDRWSEYRREHGV